MLSRVGLFATPWTVAMDRGAWWATVHGVTKSRTLLSDFTATIQLYSINLTILPELKIPKTCLYPGSLFYYQKRTLLSTNSFHH